MPIKKCIGTTLKDVTCESVVLVVNIQGQCLIEKERTLVEELYAKELSTLQDSIKQAEQLPGDVVTVDRGAEYGRGTVRYVHFLILSSDQETEVFIVSIALATLGQHLEQNKISICSIPRISEVLGSPDQSAVDQRLVANEYSKPLYHHSVQFLVRY